MGEMQYISYTFGGYSLKTWLESTSTGRQRVNKEKLLHTLSLPPPVCVCTGVCACGSEGMSEADTGSLPPLLLTYSLRQGLSANPSLPFWLDWLASKLQGDPVSPLLPYPGVTGTCHCTQHLHGSWGPNSGLHAYTAGASPTEPSPQCLSDAFF